MEPLNNVSFGTTYSRRQKNLPMNGPGRSTGPRSRVNGDGTGAERTGPEWGCPFPFIARSTAINSRKTGNSHIAPFTFESERLVEAASHSYLHKRHADVSGVSRGGGDRGVRTPPSASTH